MNRICVSAAALLALAGAAHAQSVQFEFYERTGQTSVSSADALLVIGVRARVTGGASLATFNFDIITDDAESNGTLGRARISNSGAYVSNASAWAQNSTIGTGGIAATYAYLAFVNNNFNGLINLSAGSFANNPAVHEIGLITGAATGSFMLATPGMDPDGESNVGTWSGYGAAATPSNNTFAPLDPALAGPFFGQGQFIDLYHFRYTVTNFAQRDVTFTLRDLSAQVFNQFVFNNGAWGSVNLPATFTSSILTIGVVPTPASAALVGLGGLVAVRRRRA